MPTRHCRDRPPGWQLKGIAGTAGEQDPRPNEPLRARWSTINGKMARCLQSLVLAREGILTPAFSSIEEYLGRNTRAYHDVLAAVGGGQWNPGNDARPWLRFILTAHLRQARTLLRRVQEGERLWTEIDRLIDVHGLPERSQHAIFDAAMGMRVRNSMYRAVLANMGEEITDGTASRDFRQLVDTGLLQPHGERRGRFYTAGDPILRARQDIVDARDPRDDADPFADGPVQEALL